MKGKFYREIVVDEENASMIENYEFTVNLEADGRDYQAKLEDLKTRVESGELAKVLGWKAPNIEAICFNPHLFYPLMTIENQAALPFTMKPLSMKEESEIQFVEGLKMHMQLIYLVNGQVVKSCIYYAMQQIKLKV